jgi:phosphoglycolate phosphatase-like HAD superfamily hydrolase
MAGPVAVDLDGALCDTRPLWNDWLEAVAGTLGIDEAQLPADRGEAAAELDRRGTGNWRVLLERFCEERAAVYLRRDASTSAALRALASSGSSIGVFTDAPAALASVALAQLGADRHVVAVETGVGALEHLLERFNGEAVIVRSRSELIQQASA